MKKILGIISVIAMVAAAAPAFAQTATSSTDLQALLAEVQQLQVQVQQLQQQLQQQQKLQTQSQAVLASLVSTLSEGSSGEQVKVLQAALAADPTVYPQGLITGFYGPLTKMAVMRFQHEHDLPEVGAVGPQTLDALNQELDHNPIGMESPNATSSGETSTGSNGGQPCAIVPPGHLIAPGWLRKNGGSEPVVPECQTLPLGIENILNGEGPTLPVLPPTATSTASTTPPAISGLASAVASTTATISWVTNEPATSQILYGTSTAMGASTELDDTLVTNHSQELSELAASTTYYYVAQSKDAAGNLASSTQETFTTPGQ